MLPCGTPKLLSWVDHVLNISLYICIVVVLKYSSELTLRFPQKSSFYKAFEVK